LHRLICIVTPQKNAYSESFIRAHIELLPGKVKVLYGWLNAHAEDGRALLTVPWRLLCRATRDMRSILGEKRSEDILRSINITALARFFKKKWVEVVLAEYGPTGVAVLPACRLADIPLVVHFHGCDASDKPVLQKYAAAYRSMFPEAGAIIAVSQDMQEQLLALGAPPEKLYLNPCGVNCSIFSQTDPGANPPRFLAVGRFVDKKAPHISILAFQKVAEAYPDARMTMAGDGPLWEACKQLVKALKIDDKVKFTGVLSYSEVQAEMNQARSFIQHSFTPDSGDSEGTPVAILEAGASGLPVVSTRHGGIKESVIHGETGFLVDEGDIDAMAQYMLTLAKDPTLARTMGQRARQHICANYSMEKSIAGLWNIIQSVIAQQ